MVDGDELNIVADPVIVEVAERNVKEFDVIPLFYDAGKAEPEQLSKEALFHGLKRAHEGSDIGEISNMLTKLWNRDKPDRYAAALITRKNNAVIDQAKTGYLVDWTDNPTLTRRINKATGGKAGRLPAFFFWTKNGRANEKKKKKKTYAKPNKSTMNRISAVFDDIGNINMNWAGIAPFNYQMLMSEPFSEKNSEMIQTFRDLDSMSISSEIAAAELSPSEREITNNYELLAEIITETLIEKYGSLENCYPYITKHLFSGDNWKKPSHKKMFWRIFGDIALRILQENMKNYHTCEYCGAKIPNWAKTHNCPKNDQGFFVCEDCGKQCQRTGSRQNRCDECQRNHRDEAKRLSASRRRERQKEYDEKCIGYLRSFLTPTLETEHGGRRLSFVKVGQQTKNDQDGE